MPITEVRVLRLNMSAKSAGDFLITRCTTTVYSYVVTGKRCRLTDMTPKFVIAMGIRVNRLYLL